MNVTVKLFATLRDGRFDIKQEQCRRGALIRDIVDRYAIPRDQAAIIFVNNKHAALDYPLKDGDTLAIFPPIGGG